MEEREARPARIALLIATAVLAIALAVIEALAADREAANPATAPWAAPLQRVDEALRRNNTRVADGAWHDAYVISIGSRRWEALVAVGDAALRVGDATGSRLAARSRARQAYLVALFRARDERSLDGLLRVGEAFAALGDQAMAIHCLHLTETVVTNGPDGMEIRELPSASSLALVGSSPRTWR